MTRGIGRQCRVDKGSAVGQKFLFGRTAWLEITTDEPLSSAAVVTRGCEQGVGNCLVRVGKDQRRTRVGGIGRISQFSRVFHLFLVGNAVKTDVKPF